MDAPHAVAVLDRRADRRRGHRIDPAFQSRFRLRMLGLALVVATLCMLLSRGVSWVVAHPESLPESLWVPATLAGLGVLASAAILGLCDRLSHRYCGPAWRILRTLEAVRRGERPEPIRLRRGDEFQELAEELNGVLRQLGALDPPARPRAPDAEGEAG